MNKSIEGIDVENYVNKPSLIPIYFGKQRITTVAFEPNLNVQNVPAYVNESCNMGIVRIEKGYYKNKLVIMYEDEFYPSHNMGEFISEDDAYDLCIKRGKNNIIKKYNISPSEKKNEMED